MNSWLPITLTLGELSGTLGREAQRRAEELKAPLLMADAAALSSSLTGAR